MTQRIIKFRAWDTKQRPTEWRNGKKVTLRGHMYQWDDIELWHPEDLCNLFFKPKSGYILMQSTNLFDKNGKEIYEGDVVTLENKIALNLAGGGPWEVVFAQGRFHPVSDWEYDFEIIGDIYSNPELLK